MRRIAFIFTALMLLASCSKGYKVTVTLPDGSNNGETVFLTNYDTGDTIATAMVENNMCTLGTSGASALMLYLPFLSTFTLSIMNHSPLLDCSSTSVVVSPEPSMVPSMWNWLLLQAVKAATARIIKNIFFIVCV